MFARLFHVITTSIVGYFSWDEKIKEDDLINYLELNAPAVLFLYIRPFISNMTAYSGFSPLILPLINFINSREKLNK